MEFVTLNFKHSPGVRNATLDNKDTVVVPSVFMTEGVHSGSSGPLYYSKEVLQESALSWNGRPVYINHPKNANGVPAVGGNVGTWESRIGHTMNVKWDGKLKGEVWADMKHSDMFNRMQEVSTGGFLKVRNEAGNWNGEDYVGVVETFYPDHLAILPDEEGACSIADGAGAPRINSKGGNMPETTTPEVAKYDFEKEVGLIKESLKSLTDTVTNMATMLKPVEAPARDEQAIAAIAYMDKLREERIGALTANSKCVFTKEELAGKCISELDKIASMLTAVVAPPAPVTNSSSAVEPLPNPYK